MQSAHYSNGSITTLNACLLLVTAILTGIAVAWSSFNEYSGWFSLTILLLLGIPHGAVDHLIDLGSKGKTNFDPMFYVQYLLLMGIMGGIWLLSSGFALLMFLGISAFHFGQSQWHGIGLNKAVSYLLYFSWGTLILSTVIFFNLEQCVDLIAGMGWDFTSEWFTRKFWLWSLVTSMVLVVAILPYAWMINKIQFKQIALELLFIQLLLLLSITTDALFTFAVYFGVWHSVKALILEYEFLNKVVKTPARFILQLLPYTLMALIGLFSLHIIFKLYLPEVSIYMVLFVLISLLTVPHLVIMHPVYESN